jgi:hypothetical protein
MPNNRSKQNPLKSYFRTQTEALEHWKNLTESQQEEVAQEELAKYRENVSVTDAKAGRRSLIHEREQLRQIIKGENRSDVTRVLLDRMDLINARLADFANKDEADGVVRPVLRKAKPTRLKRLLSGDSTDEAVQNMFQSALTTADQQTCILPEAHSGVALVSEFKEYIWGKSLNSDSQWGANNVGSEWYAPNGHGIDWRDIDFPNALANTSHLRFDTFATHSAYPIGLSKCNSIASAGVLKFVLPDQPCNSVISWRIQPIIDLIMGAFVDGNSHISIEFVVCEQPESTAFPDCKDDGEFEETFEFELTVPYIKYNSEGWHWQRLTQQQFVDGEFYVKAGVTSSVLFGVSVRAVAHDGIACIGDNTNNRSLHGALHFGHNYSVPEGLQLPPLSHPTIFYHVVPVNF